VARAQKSNESDIVFKLAQRVRELRERAGLTQGELAGASNISRVYFGTLERAEKEASVTTLEKLARGLRVEPADLLRVDGPPGLEPDDEVEKLARKIAALARESSVSSLRRFEKIAKAYFEAEEPVRTPRPNRAPPRARASRLTGGRTRRPRSTS
jgi:transcriptional regulator with XRE-family HTH domain